MIIKITDYENSKKEIKLRPLEEIARIWIEVITGDEILHVLYKNYDIEEYDSSNCRMSDFFDDEYVIYDITKNINYLDSWSKRKSSYDYELKGD